MRFLSIAIILGIAIFLPNSYSIYADGSISVNSDDGNTDVAFGYNRAADVLGGEVNIKKQIDENKNAAVQIGVTHDRVAGAGSVKINGDKFNTTVILSGIFDKLEKATKGQFAVALSKYFSSIGEAELAAAINSDKQPSIGAAIEKMLGKYKVKAGGLFNVISKDFENLGVAVEKGNNLFGVAKTFGDVIAFVTNNGGMESKYLDLTHVENMYYSYAQKYLQGILKFAGNKDFQNNFSYNFNGVVYNYSLFSNAQLKYKKDNYEVIGGLSGTNGFVQNQIIKYIVGNYFTKVMEKFVTLQGTLNFGEHIVPSFLVAVDDVANSVVSIGYNGNLRGIQNAVFGIVTHTFEVSKQPMTLTLRVGGLANNLLGIIQVNGKYLGQNIKMQGMIHKDGNYNLVPVEEFIDLKKL